MSSIHLKPGVRHRIKAGHPWVFKTEIGRVEGTPADGDSVEIRDEKGKSLGSGIYNAQSQITVRRYSLRRETLDRDFLSTALDRAFAFRKGLPPRAAQRLVWSESDSLPGLILDRYQETLVLQTLTAAMARHQETIVELALSKTGLSTVIARNDAPVRQLEGLTLEKKIVAGNYEPPTPVEICGLPFALDLWTGQKTGFYLDQMDNYELVSQHAAGRRVLDVFCNQGAFALLCKKRGATECLALDQSAEALSRGRETAKRAGLPLTWVEANAFDWLRETERTRRVFDLIILDPPSFTKSKQQVAAAVRGYHELHLRALKLLTPGGLLASFTCSHSMTDAIWREMLEAAAADAGCSLRLRQIFSQGADHPILLHIPETEYLRGFLLEKI
jgi:23S rRNA (cytosine1962-C5)-methyltransferase